ncbi:MAG TPA: aminodeoxychorismate synthase component I [Gammaproteobacteria bacterium]
MAIREIHGTPDLLALHRHDPLRYPHLLESAARGEPLGRFDILFAFPDESLVLDGNGELQGPHAASGFLDSLQAWMNAEHAAVEESAAHLPFHGGWFVFLAYELAGEIEPKLRLFPDRRWPIACATRFPAAVIRDHLEHKSWLVSEDESLIATLLADLAAAKDIPEISPLDFQDMFEEGAHRYERMVERVVRYIIDGDVFQANISRAWTGNIGSGIPHWTIYDHLRRANPAPFAALVTWNDQAIISSSPERLVEIRGECVQTRPIAGTRPRGDDPERDRELLNELIAHPKERAEHIMLIDLERNDLGRIAIPGSVEVNELMALESYAHVHHIVSNVRAKRRPGIGATDVIRAVFPGGTITGCPKVRCMEIIAELEQDSRCAYTGSLGYFNRDGSGDFNILIRTIMRNGEDISFRAGAGIVADSIPEREVAETRAKARGMLLALAGEQ